jgi:hypothetical protein
VGRLSGEVGLVVELIARPSFQERVRGWGGEDSSMGCYASRSH